MTPQEAVAAAKSAQAGKAMVAPGGWIFLANDTNDFLSWQFGVRRWTEAEAARVDAILSERIARLAPAPYLMFITPEKSVVYPEYLPHGLDRLAPYDRRPARALAAMAPDSATYLLDEVQRRKPLGFLYFRGDTHVNWLGAYFIYRTAVERVIAAGVAVPPPIPYGRMKLRVAGMEGDLYAQIDPDQRDPFEAEAGVLKHSNMLEASISISLKEPHPQAVAVEPTPEDLARFNGRELIIKEHPDKTLPRAVIFRDSTATLLIDFLAEHFSRAVFIWREGDVIEDFIAEERPDVVLHFVAERFLASYPRTPPLSRLAELQPPST